MRGEALTLFVVLVPALAWAQVPAGSEFRVNTYTTSGGDMPSLASLPGGGYVVVWRSDTESAVAGQLLESSGSFRGSEFQVAPGPERVRWPDVATDRRGRFVVAWEGPGANGLYRIAARRFDPSGAPLGGVFAVSTATANAAYGPAVAMQRGGAFVVVWGSDGQDGSQSGVFGQRFDGSGRPVGGEFQVNTYTTLEQLLPSVAADESGRFVVVWRSNGQDGSQFGVFGQRFLPDGTRAGMEFQVNSYTTDFQFDAHVMAAPGGEFVVVWRASTSTDYALWSRRFDASGTPQGPDVRLHGLPGRLVSGTDAAVSAAGDFAALWDWRFGTPPIGFNVLGRRFDSTGTPRGQEFLVTAYTNTFASDLPMSSMASDESGNLLVAWRTPEPEIDVYARRYGGLIPAALSVADSGGGILEVGDTFLLNTAWRNVNGAAQTVQGRGSNVVVPAGMNLTLTPNTDYGTIPDGAVVSCRACFSGTLGDTRTPGHADMSVLETLEPDALGQTKRWVVHVAESFTDVPRANPFYRFVETLLHRGITAGCGPNTYCPAASTTREQMAVFLLLAKEAAGYSPAACTTPAFPDVPASSPFCRWIEELARRGVVSGCGGGNYCPNDAVTREQMAVFLLRTLDPALDPPACTTPVFADVPASSPFCRWIEELARRGVVTGCGGGNYCPSAPVTREQMAVFLSATFGLTLYGP